MKMYRTGFFALAFALGAMLAATSADAQVVSGTENISTRYDFSVNTNANIFSRVVRSAHPRNVIHQFKPKQIKRNARRVLRAPIDAGKMIFDGVDDAGKFLINRKGKNYTGFSCLQCGREQRLASIANGQRDCKFGDVTYGWKHPSCSKPAPAGAINSVRITGPHIERVVGRCHGNLIAVADGNGPGGVNSVRCVTVGGATYHYPLPKTGNASIDGPFYMQPDPCKGRGRNPRHSA